MITCLHLQLSWHICKAFGGLCSFLAAFLAKFMVHAVAPCKVRGPPTTPARLGVHIGFFFSPASLCQRVPPIRGAPMAPTTARTTRVRRVWLVCVVGGGLFGPPPVPIPPTLGGLGRKKAFGFVASFLLQQRGLCILVVASLFKYTYAIACMYIYLYAQTLTCPNVFESLHAGRNHFFPTDGCFSYVFLVSHQSWLGWWKGQNVERILAGPYPAAGASMF